MYPSTRFNEDLEVDNVVEFDVDHDVVRACYADVNDIVDEGYFEGIRESGNSGIGLYSFCPNWNGDLRWISSSNDVGFSFFDKYFAKLKIIQQTKNLLGDCGELIMYSGFFVVRSHTSKPYYHEDYGSNVGLNAFTLMTPVLPTGQSGNLLYHNAYDEEKIYPYSCGRAVAFGGGFYHSTEPFESPTPYAFLCFTFGVTDMELWPSISETAAEQGLLYRHPERGIVKVESAT